MHPTHQEKTTFTYSLGTFSYRVLHFGFCNAPTTFQRVVLSIFKNFVYDNMEIYIDYFTPYGGTFNKSLRILEFFLKKCIEMSLCLSNEKCEMLMKHHIVLANHISPLV